MSRGTYKGRRKARTTVVLVTAIAAASSVASAAFAETYRTPGNEAAVGTTGSNADAQYLAVSDYGTATAWNGMAVNYLGTANGTVAASWAGSANGQAAASGLGTANGWLVAASGTGTANSSLAAFSLTGPAYGWTAAVSGTGHAQGSTYNSVAVSGTGTASSGPGGIAVSGTGTANGPVAVSGTGTSSAAQGTATEAAYTVTSTGEVIYHTAVNLTNDPYQAWVVATNPPDPLGVAAKERALAEDAVGVAQNVAEGLLQPAESLQSNSATPSSTTASNRPPSSRDLGLTPIYQSTQYRCVPATAHTLYVNTGSPGQEELARDMGTDRARGTTFDVAAPVIDRYYQGPDTITARSPKDATELLSLVTTDVWRYNHGVMLAMNPALLHWAQHRHANHAVAAVGYNHNSGGYLTIIDGFYPNMSDWEWGTRTSPNGTRYGSAVPTPTSRRWYFPVREVLGAMESVKAKYNVVW